MTRGLMPVARVEPSTIPFPLQAGHRLHLPRLAAGHCGRQPFSWDPLATRRLSTDSIVEAEMEELNVGALSLSR